MYILIQYEKKNKQMCKNNPVLLINPILLYTSSSHSYKVFYTFAINIIVLIKLALPLYLWCG